MTWLNSIKFSGSKYLFRTIFLMFIKNIGTRLLNKLTGKNIRGILFLSPRREFKICRKRKTCLSAVALAQTEIFLNTHRHHMKNKENIKRETEQKIEYPPTLDIIKVDGRWAQAYSSSATEILINYLDNNEKNRLNLNKFELVRKYGTNVDMLDQAHEIMSDEEMKNIYYDSETTKLPEETQRIRKGWVHVFGEYKKRR